MNLEDRLTHVSVIGAAGKMGSGIALLLAQEMAFQKLSHPDRVFTLYLIDRNESVLDGLWSYIESQSLKTAESQIGLLRELFKDRKDLVENGDMVQEYVKCVLSVLRPTTEQNCARNSKMVFEAIVEKEEVKVKIFENLRSLCPEDTFFFTNTSSIPIQVLDDKAGLNGRLIGFHFYNPPAVQKLVELISSPKTQPSLVELSNAIAKQLKKKVIPANDMAGFIGNGHFIRDGVYGISEAKRLEAEFGRTGSIYLVNKVSQDLLLRPMGIFQLIDYVGVDVFQCIQNVMAHYLSDESLRDSWIDEMVEKSVLGGQKSDGSQKDGFLKYEKNQPVGVYDIASNSYRLFAEADWGKGMDEKLGAYPSLWAPWKKWLQDPKQPEKLKSFFDQLKGHSTLGAQLALAYLKNSRQIGEKLVQTGVAKSPDDVNGVLLTGFFHLYGPINEYV